MGTEEEDSPALATDRPYWESRSTKQVLTVMDSLVELARNIDPRLVARYNKYYIGLGIDGLANNFISFKPRKKHVCLQIKIPASAETDEILENTDMPLLEYDKRWRNYRIQVTQSDVDKNRELLLGLMRQAYELRNG
jgi:predicted transport protein